MLHQFLERRTSNAENITNLNGQISLADSIEVREVKASLAAASERGLVEMSAEAATEVLAVFGWQISDLGLHCNLCGRSTSCNSAAHSSDDAEADNGDLLEAPRSKRLKSEPLDPVALHRWFCPWIRGHPPHHRARFDQ